MTNLALPIPQNIINNASEALIDIFLYLRRQSKNCGYCYASTRVMARHTGYSEASIRNAITIFFKAGMIYEKYRQSKLRQIFVATFEEMQKLPCNRPDFGRLRELLKSAKNYAISIAKKVVKSCTNLPKTTQVTTQVNYSNTLSLEERSRAEERHLFDKVLRSEICDDFCEDDLCYVWSGINYKNGQHYQRSGEKIRSFYSFIKISLRNNKKKRQAKRKLDAEREKAEVKKINSERAHKIYCLTPEERRASGGMSDEDRKMIANWK